MEGDNVIGLKQGKQSVTLEPGGQLELSGAPLETLHQTYFEINSHLCQVKAIAGKMGIGFLGIGFQPKWEDKDMPLIPMVNLDFSSELDMVRKFRASLALQPIATALFANSPFTKGKQNGYLSMRSHTWTDLDKNRTGMLPFVFDDSFGFERYIDYALDVPMDLYLSAKEDFMAGKLPALPGQFPTMNDWENHLTGVYPEVRLKRYLEMRGADSGPLMMLCALPAFWVGLIYDEVSLQNVLEMIADWTTEERQMLRDKVPMTGLNTPFQGGFVKDVAERVIKWAKDGLERRGLKEAVYLNELEEVVTTGVTPAEKLLKMYNEKWGQNADSVFEELRY
uniref:glutamate--cysteine ligase n=1 Tax=Fagus sylvatica TaxID=28930 RepID=A0A2N9F5D7_FAGSY